MRETMADMNEIASRLTEALALTLLRLQAGGIKFTTHRPSCPYPRGPYYSKDGETLAFVPEATGIKSPTYELEWIVRSIPQFNSIEELSVRNGAGGSFHPLSPAHIIASVITTAWETSSVNEAVGHLLRVINSNSAQCSYFAAMDGIIVTEPLRLAEDIRLVPFSEVPPTSNRRYLENPEKLPSNPTAVLVMDYIMNDLFCSKDAATVPAEASTNAALRLRAAADCLMVATESAAGIVAEWGRLCDFGAPRFPDTNLTLDPIIAYNPAYRDEKRPDLADRERLACALDRWSAFKGNQTQLHLACTRLRRARRMMHKEDRAIDLGVALEVILSGELSGNQELTHRLSARGAWMLGRDPNERIELARWFRSLYDLRSKAVHTGKVDGSVKVGSNKLYVGDVLAMGFKLCNNLLQTIVECGNWPNWDRITMGEPRDKPLIS